MSFKRALRCLTVAAAFGVPCELTALIGVNAAIIGALVTLAIGLLALILTPRNEQSGESLMTEYGAWLICVAGFAITTIALAPVCGPLGVSTAIALCFSSPLLGTMVYTVERYLWRPRATNQQPAV